MFVFWLMGLLWFSFSLMGHGTFVLIFAVCLFWLDFGTKSSYSNLAFWAKRPEHQGLNHCKFIYKFVNLVFFFYKWFILISLTSDLLFGNHVSWVSWEIIWVFDLYGRLGLIFERGVPCILKCLWHMWLWLWC